MHRHYGLLVILTTLIVAAGFYDAYMAFHQSGLPFSFHIVDAHTAVIEPIPGTPLPSALRAGDRIDLTASPLPTRIAIIRAARSENGVAVGRTYGFVIRRGGHFVTVPVTSIATPESATSAELKGADEWAALWLFALLSAIALLALWRGRDRAAAGLALWAFASLAGFAVIFMPFDNRVGLDVSLVAWIFFLLERVGFYITVEFIVGSAFTAWARELWRGGFLLLLGAAAVVAFGGPLVFVATGSAQLLRSTYGFAMTASYLPPIALLFAGYRRADGVLRLRLRWMLWSSVVFATGIFLSNTPILGYWLSVLGADVMPAIALGGFLYAVLRHRVVDVSVVLSRTLVYAMTTSLVLGLFALLESLVERSALGQDASLVLELAVPLGLGAGLSTVHRRIEVTVERLVFWRQYRTESALRSFAQECAFITQPEKLLDLTVIQIARHTGATRVALYERTPEGYARVRQHGGSALPAQVAVDDFAFVKLRARNAAVDLDDTQSDLGQDGYAFPLMVRGNLLGALVVGERPGERFAADERELLFGVAHEVGMALFALRALESEVQVRESKARVLAAEARAEASEAQAHATAKQLLEASAREAKAQARESALLIALSTLGSDTSK
jgi:hypothetical protein